MTLQTAEILGPNIVDLGSPAPSEPTHSEGGFLPAEQANRRIDRLKMVIQSKKPYKVFDIAGYEETANGGPKPLAQVALEGEARKISTNMKPDTLDAVDYACATTPERIVRVKSGVEGAPVRGNSAHGVMFLELGTQRGEFIDTAVKIFTTPSHAFIEWSNTQAIRARGIETLEPIAVIIDQGKGTNGKSKEEDGPVGFYISTMEPIRSLDRLRVLRMGYTALINGDSNEREYLGYMRTVGRILAEMHFRGVFPKDSQIKNFAIREDGSIIPIDFENTEIYNPDLQLKDPERFVSRAAKGLNILFNSLHGETKPVINFFEGYSGESLWEAFNDTVFKGYMEAYEDAALQMGTNDEDPEGMNNMTTCLNNLYQLNAKIKEHVLENRVTVNHQ